MNPISAAGSPGDSSGAAGAEQADDVQIALLKKAQDMAAQQSSELLATLPPPPQAPSPPGVGQHVDIRA
jgi:hypothetical protein